MKNIFRLALAALFISVSTGTFAQDVKKTSPETKQQPATKTKSTKKGDDSKIPAKRKAVKAAPAKSVYKSK